MWKQPAGSHKHSVFSQISFIVNVAIAQDRVTTIQYEVLIVKQLVAFLRNALAKRLHLDVQPSTVHQPIVLHREQIIRKADVYKRTIVIYNIFAFLYCMHSKHRKELPQDFPLLLQSKWPLPLTHQCSLCIHTSLGKLGSSRHSLIVQ